MKGKGAFLSVWFGSCACSFVSWYTNTADKNNSYQKYSTGHTSTRPLTAN